MDNNTVKFGVKKTIPVYHFNHRHNTTVYIHVHVCEGIIIYDIVCDATCLSAMHHMLLFKKTLILIKPVCQFFKPGLFMVIFCTHVVQTTYIAAVSHIQLFTLAAVLHI